MLRFDAIDIRLRIRVLRHVHGNEVAFDFERLVDRHAKARRRQGVTQVAQTLGEPGELGYAGCWRLESGKRAGDRGRHRGDGGDALGGRRLSTGKQALDVGLGRRGDLGDDRDFGHRECAIQCVDRALHALVGALRSIRTGRHPAIDGDQVPGDFGVQDFQQHRVDRCRHAGFFDVDVQRGHVRRDRHNRRHSHVVARRLVVDVFA